MPAAIPAIIAAGSAATSAHAQSKAQKNATKALDQIKFDPVEWQSFGGSDLNYNQSPELQQSMQSIGDMISGMPKDNQYLDIAGDYFKRITSDNYQAYSDEYLKEQFDSTKGKLGDVFKEQEGQISSKLANQGLAGSGASTIDWGGQAEKEKKIFADVWSDLQTQNVEATRADKTQALNMSPQLAQMQMQMQQQPLQNQLVWQNLVNQQNTALNNVDMWNANREWDEWLQRIGIEQFNASNDLQAKIAKGGGQANLYSGMGQSAGNNTAALGSLMSMFGNMFGGGGEGAS